jgi:hypothetical protein
MSAAGRRAMLDRGHGQHLAAYLVGPASETGRHPLAAAGDFDLLTSPCHAWPPMISCRSSCSGGW